MTIPKNGNKRNQTIPRKVKCKKCGNTIKVNEDNTQYLANVALISCEKCEDCVEIILY